MQKDQPEEGDTVYIYQNPYPFTFKRVGENGRPVLWGDFSNGFFPANVGCIESECEWDEITSYWDKEKQKIIFYELHD